jgi:hypothetical protein
VGILPATPAGDRLYVVTAAGVPGVEAWIEAVQRRGDTAFVTLCLADGTAARSVVAGDCADWLDLRPGQIVTVAATSAGDPRFPVVGERVDLAREPIIRDVSEADGLQDAPHARAQSDPDAL